MSLFKFSRPLRKSTADEEKLHHEIDKHNAQHEARVYKAAYEKELDKNKPPEPLPENEYCQKLARLKRERDSHKNAKAYLCSDIVRNAFCQDLGSDYEYNQIMKIVCLKLLIAEANILNCELCQQACDLATAECQMQSCCEDVMCRVEGKDVSSDTYQGLMQCVLVKC